MVEAFRCKMCGSHDKDPKIVDVCKKCAKDEKELWKFYNRKILYNGRLVVSG